MEFVTPVFLSGACCSCIEPESMRNGGHIVGLFKTHNGAGSATGRHGRVAMINPDAEVYLYSLSIILARIRYSENPVSLALW